MPHVILTGAAGFVGSHVLRHLLTETDWTIACPVSFRHKGVPERIGVALSDHQEWWQRVNVVHCNLAAPLGTQTLRLLDAENCRYLLNVASESHVDRSISDPVGFVENNVSLILNVLEAARRMPRLRAMVQVSTDEVYGPAPDGHRHREWETILPSNPYSASKAAQEAIAISYWRTFGVPLILTNTMNIIGETQDSEKYVPMVMKHALAGEVISVHASPEGRPGSRFYLHARNQADALLFLCQQVGLGTVYTTWSADVDRPARYHVVGEREVDNLEMARLVSEFAGVKDPQVELVSFHATRPGHDLRYALDGSRIAALGWKAPVPFEESLKRAVEWTLRHPEWL